MFFCDRRALCTVPTVRPRDVPHVEEWGAVMRMMELGSQKKRQVVELSPPMAIYHLRKIPPSAKEGLFSSVRVVWRPSGAVGCPGMASKGPVYTADCRYPGCVAFEANDSCYLLGRRRDVRRSKSVLTRHFSRVLPSEDSSVNPAPGFARADPASRRLLGRMRNRCMYGLKRSTRKGPQTLHQGSWKSASPRHP